MYVFYLCFWCMYLCYVLLRLWPTKMSRAYWEEHFYLSFSHQHLFFFCCFGTLFKIFSPHIFLWYTYNIHIYLYRSHLSLVNSECLCGICGEWPSESESQENMTKPEQAQSFLECTRLLILLHLLLLLKPRPSDLSVCLLTRHVAVSSRERLYKVVCRTVYTHLMIAHPLTSLIVLLTAPPSFPLAQLWLRL